MEETINLHNFFLSRNKKWFFLMSFLSFCRFADAREQVRLIKHRELRQAVVAGDERTVRVLLEALGSEKPIIVNMAPAGANTLLYQLVYK